MPASSGRLGSTVSIVLFMSSDIVSFIVTLSESGTSVTIICSSVARSPKDASPSISEYESGSIESMYPEPKMRSSRKAANCLSVTVAVTDEPSFQPVNAASFSVSKLSLLSMSRSDAVTSPPPVASPSRSRMYSESSTASSPVLKNNVPLAAS